ncbi:phosphatidate cytidylyltransferase [Myxococcota bacterium]
MIAALVFTPAFIAVVILGGWALKITCLVMAWLLMWEYLQLALGQGHAYLKVVGFLGGTGLALHVVGLLPALPLGPAIMAATLVLFVAILAHPDPIETSIARIAFVGLGVVYCGGLFPYLARLRGMEEGLTLAAAALFCTWAADTGAYFAGRSLGRHRLYPKISPKKTVEGCVGGILAAVGAAFLVCWLFDSSLELLHVIVIGAVAAVVGTVGDLTASLLKRSVGAKDSGNLIPGHGGVLDRFDGVMFVAPTIYLYVLVVFDSASHQVA